MGKLLKLVDITTVGMGNPAMAMDVTLHFQYIMDTKGDTKLKLVVITIVGMRMNPAMAMDVTLHFQHIMDTKGDLKSVNIVLAYLLKLTSRFAGLKLIQFYKMKKDTF